MTSIHKRPIVSGMNLTRIGSNVPAPTIELNSELAYRSVQIERAAIDKKARTIEFTFSSDIEIERWPGVIEVLSHAPDAVDLTRLQNGAQLLFNHSPDEYVGVVEGADIVANRKGRCVGRFSNHEHAEKIWQDVQDGILRNVSVGYRIREVKLAEERESGKDVYVVTKWEPYEVSIVTIPADVSIGIGRDMRCLFTKSNPHQNQNQMNREKAISILRTRGVSFNPEASDDELIALAGSRSPITTNERAAGAAEERERVNSIMTAGRSYKQVELAQRAVEEGKTIDQFREMLIDAIDGRNQRTYDGNAPIGLSEKEATSFSFVRLLRSLAEPDDRKLFEASRFEREACDVAGRQVTHRASQGLTIPVDVLLQPIGGHTRGDIVSVKTGSGYTGTGGKAVPTTFLASSFIDLLRSRNVLMGLCMELGGLVGNVDMPKQTAGSTAYWIGEDEAATLEDIEFGAVQLTPKTVASMGEVTRKMLVQNGISMEAVFRMDLAKGLSGEIDRAGFYGLAASNQPRGLKLLSGINTADWAAANAPTYGEIVGMESAIAADNADAESMVYIMNSTMRGYLKSTQKFASSNGVPIWEPGDTLNGYGTRVSNQIAAGDVFFGNFADMVIGMWGGLDINVDPYTHSSKGRVRYTAFQDVDFGYRRAESFCYNKNVVV